jgi:nucleotide-binding universal stress UspA family protein
MEEIVVGLDMSPSAAVAVQWAADQARRTGMPLRAIHALLIPPELTAAAIVGSSKRVPDDAVERSYREAVKVVWESVQPERHWQLQFFNADPGPLLVNEAAHAAILVIGTREHVGFGRILLGSVSHYCLSHAQCPVVAVPVDRERTMPSGRQARDDIPASG